MVGWLSTSALHSVLSAVAPSSKTVGSLSPYLFRSLNRNACSGFEGVLGPLIINTLLTLLGLYSSYTSGDVLPSELFRSVLSDILPGRGTLRNENCWG